MKKLFLLFLVALSAAMLTSCGDKQDPQLEVIRDAVFAEVPIRSNEANSDSDSVGSKSLTLNIWKGRGERPQPVVLFVHGGAWVSGNNNIDESDSEQIRAIMEPFSAFRTDYR